MTIVDYLTSLFIEALKKTSNLHENSGTVEYFAGQENVRLAGPQGKWLKKLSLSHVYYRIMFISSKAIIEIDY